MKHFILFSVPFLSCLACYLLGALITFAIPELPQTTAACFGLGLLVLGIVPPVWALFAEVNRQGKAAGLSLE